jgi:hypothetical protein
VSLQVGTGKAGQVNALLENLARGRSDHQFFSRTFLNRTLHDGQLEYVQNASATINCLATANRYGKTTVLSHIHYHANVYKTGGEPKYLGADGAIDLQAFERLKYHTTHVAGDLETTLLVWEEALKIKGESPALAAFIKDAPRSKPPHIDFIFGSKWKFRTLGHDASGIDGNSFYVISIDEAGWINDLDPKMSNVIRVRVADVRGCIHIVGTFKPGISKDFYKFCVRASAYTGKGLVLDHRLDADAADAAGNDQTLDAAIRHYLRAEVKKWVEQGREMGSEVWDNLATLGITRDEFTDAIGGR